MNRLSWLNNQMQIAYDRMCRYDDWHSRLGALYMMVLGLLLFANAILHVVIVGRFGIKGNEPPAVFGVLYAVLGIAAFVGWSQVVLATLIVTTVGIVGLGVNFKKLKHDNTIEKIILVLGFLIIGYASYLNWAI